jgi:flagellar motor switch protein FliG
MDWLNRRGEIIFMNITALELPRQEPLLLPYDAGFEPANLPGLRKAAILLVALGDDLTRSLLQSLSETDVHRVTGEITKLGDIPADLITQVLTEFYGLLETQQYVVRGGTELAMKVLTEAFGPVKAEALLTQVQKIRERSTGDMAMLQKIDPQQLGKFLELEHPQTIALVLAHLDAKHGSTVLMGLPIEMRIEVVRRLAEIRQFSPEVARKVALTLHRRVEGMGTGGRKSYSGCKAAAEILNRIDQTTSKGILEEIEQGQPQLAIGIRNLMFTFDDLLTVPIESVREIVSAADKRVLALALKGSREQLQAHIFRSMSTRAVEMLKEDMESMGPVRMKEVALAQQELLILARQLESEGKMILKMEIDDEFTV